MAHATSCRPQVVISADGKSASTRRSRKPSSAQALVKSSALDGTNAVPARSGKNGMHVKIELLPGSHGGFLAKDLGRKPHPPTHVAKGSDLLVSTKGSDGEDGGRGGDGRQGNPGRDGRDATEHSDAKSGGDGGRGGNGGFGSSGGDGGNGGLVEVVTSEHNMHLILAVGWDVEGGKGGQAGTHGSPGPGGKGGRGGKSFKWQELTGYEWQCVQHATPYYDGELTSSRQALTANNLAALDRRRSERDHTRAALNQLQSGRDLAFSFGHGYVTDGTNIAQVSNLQGRIPASMGPQFQRALAGSDSNSDSANALTRRNGDVARDGHEPGCRQVPTYTTRRKPGAPNGDKGPPGQSPTTSLSPGRNGANGTGAILVRHDDGSVSSYHAKFQFQLVDFELVDENDDGIFEPGECAIVRNVTIKNTGAMPTPKKTRIPLRMVACPGLSPVPGKDVVYLPFDIAPGATKRITQEIWAKIQSSRHSQPNSMPFRAMSNVRLRAVVPDLERTLPHFDCSQDITVQYPAKLVTDEFKWLDAIPRGSSCSLQWSVINISSKDLGDQSHSQRDVLTQISCSSTASAILGGSLSAGVSDSACRKHRLELLERDMSRPVVESIHIPKNAPEYSTIEILIELLLAPPSASPARGSPTPTTIQSRKLSIQVSEAWRFSPDASFLLLTSKSTTKETIESWSKFIRDYLRMSVDVWNVSAEGGLEAEASNKSVLDSYLGKTILALDDELFHYLDRGERSILDFIDPSDGSALSRNGTKIVSVQRKASARQDREEKNIEHAAYAAALEDSAGQLQRFDATDELIAWLQKLRESPSNTGSSRRYFVSANGSNPSSKGIKIGRKLRKAFPLDQFVITDSADGLGVQVVHCGAHGQGYSTAQVAGESNGVGREAQYAGLNPAEAYTCVASLPLTTRLDILLTSQRCNSGNQCSSFVQNAAQSSIKAEIYDQVQAMAKHARWRDGLGSGSEDISTTSLFDPANDKIGTVLEHEMMLDASSAVDDPSSVAGDILRSILQSARCQTTEQLMIRWFSPFKRTRSHVRKSLMAKVQDVVVSNPSTAFQSPRDPRERFKTLKRSVSQKFTNKNYQSHINNSVRDITNNAIRDVKQSLTTIEEVAPQSTYKSATELLQEKQSYRSAETQRQRDKTQLREWRQELGMTTIAEHGPTNDDEEDVAELDDSGIYSSSKLTSSPSNDRSMLSTVSNTSTLLTVPEMDASPLGRIGSGRESRRVSELESCPSSPLVQAAIRNEKLLNSDKWTRRSVDRSSRESIASKSKIQRRTSPPAPIELPSPKVQRRPPRSTRSPPLPARTLTPPPLPSDKASSKSEPLDANLLRSSTPPPVPLSDDDDAALDMPSPSQGLRGFEGSSPCMSTPLQIVSGHSGLEVESLNERSSTSNGDHPPSSSPLQTALDSAAWGNEFDDGPLEWVEYNEDDFKINWSVDPVPEVVS